MTNETINTIHWDNLAAQFANQAALDFNALSPVQRIILTTDGTLTDILEAYALEAIKVIRLSEQSVYMQGDSPLAVTATMPLNNRKILLQGEQTGVNWLYAESFIVIERLNQQFKHRLADTNQPIGTLWNQYKIETYKETLYRFEQVAGELAESFQIQAHEPLICRTYCVFAQQQPIMLITDKMPKSLYLENKTLP